jgi:ArsR family transcriptional regulator
MKKTRHSPSALDESTRTLKAFADPVRLRLLNLLGGEREEICVCHLFEGLGLPQPTVSRHLAYLRKHGLVVGRKDGLWVHYRLAKPKTGLHGILLGCLGTSLGDPEVFRQDQERLTRKLSCSGGEE